MKSHQIIYVIILVIILVPGNLYAQFVTPSDRVVDRVIVRELPSTQSEIAGSLRKGESAILLDVVPYWYKVQLNNSVIGFVSKAWSVLSDITLIDSLKKSDLIIGSWNIKWLGRSVNENKNYKAMAEIIQRMDIIAIQEVMDPFFTERLDSLIHYLSVNGFKYNYIVSNPTGYLNNPEPGKNNYLERFSFMWDIDRVEILNTASPYKFIHTPVINNNVFRQVPVSSDFKVKDGNGFDFRLVTLHTVFNKNINHIRRMELEFINQWIIDSVTDSLNDEKNIIVIGDFNANPSRQPHHFKNIISGSTNYRVLFEESMTVNEESVRTTIQQTGNPAPGYFLLPVYDHALVTNETSYALPDNPMTKAANDLGVVAFDQEPFWQQLENWSEVINQMSDHRPVWFKLNYFAEDLD
ncbi:MAG: SH3 domain-containing protein [Ignavibacteriaceae bacterium]